MRKMKKRTKVKIHNFFVETSVVLAVLSYIIGVFGLEIDWDMYSRVCLLSLGYVLFWMCINQKYIMQIDTEDK